MHFIWAVHAMGHTVPTYTGGRYLYMSDLKTLMHAVCLVPSVLVPFITPLPWREWEMSLRQHRDKDIVAAIKQGLAFSTAVMDANTAHATCLHPETRPR